MKVGECNCLFPKIKKNFPFGRKSQADKFCKRCGNVVTNRSIMLKKRKRKNG